MQRKNYLLRANHKNGMAMMMALGVMVLLATIMALSISLTDQTTKKTVDLYLHEQAILLSKSATEYALLEISQNPNCLNNLNFVHDGIYNINVDIRYITSAATACNNYINTIITPEQNGSVLLDVTVSVIDPNTTSEPITFFRRSIQKL